MSNSRDVVVAAQSDDEVLAVKQAVAGNGWDWDINDFARRLGLRPNDVTVQEHFRRFQRVADDLRNMPDHIFLVVARRS